MKTIEKIIEDLSLLKEWGYELTQSNGTLLIFADAVNIFILPEDYIRFVKATKDSYRLDNVRGSIYFKRKGRVSVHMY